MFFPSAVILFCAVSYLYGQVNSGRMAEGWANMCWSLAWSATTWVMISVSSAEALVRIGSSCGHHREMSLRVK